MTDPFNTGLPSDAVSSWQWAFAVLFLLSICWVFWPELCTLLRGRIPRFRLTSRLTLRLAMVLPLTIVLLVGGTKGPGGYSARLVQFITALRSGLVVDDSGVVARYAETEAIRYFNSESSNMIAAARDSVTDSVALITAMGVALTSTPYICAYISADLPRAEPHQWTNHNVAATIERVDQTGGVLRVWIWYSEEPFQAPDVAFDASVADGTWVTLTAVTNSWPSTETVNGIACVRYDYNVPAEMVGTPMRPEYELSFGGYTLSSYLIAPSGGVLVNTNGVDTLPYTGWVFAWPDPWGTNLQVRFAGGIAVEANWMGSNYTGRVTL
jgi:hypothetical protein